MYIIVIYILIIWNVLFVMTALHNLKQWFLPVNIIVDHAFFKIGPDCQVVPYIEGKYKGFVILEIWMMNY